MGSDPQPRTDVGGGPSAPVGRPTNWVSGALWVLQGLLAVFLVVGAIPKLTATPEAVTAFEPLPCGPWLLALTGALEVAGAIGLLIPRATPLAAACLSALMAFATIANLTVLDTPGTAVITVALLIIFAAIAWLRVKRAAHRHRPVRGRAPEQRRAHQKLQDSEERFNS